MTSHADPIALDRAGRGVQLALVAVLLTVAASAFILGAVPLVQIASEWARLPTQVAVLLPVVLDAAAVAAALAAIVRHQRGQKAGLENVLLLLTVVVSVAAQVVHAYELAGWSPRGIIIASVLGSAPVIVLLSSHAAIRTLSQPAPKRRAARGRAVPSQARPAGEVAVAAQVTRTKAKPAAASRPRPVPPENLPERQAGEDELDYAVRLLDHGLGQRKAAEAAGVTRSRVETKLKQLAREQEVAA